MLNVAMLTVVMLTAVMLTAIMLTVIMLTVVVLTVVMLNVIMLNVVMLSVMAPHGALYYRSNKQTWLEGLAGTNFHVRNFTRRQRNVLRLWRRQVSRRQQQRDAAGGQ